MERLKLNSAQSGYVFPFQYFRVEEFPAPGRGIKVAGHSRTHARERTQATGHTRRQMVVQCTRILKVRRLEGASSLLTGQECFCQARGTPRTVRVYLILLLHVYLVRADPRCPRWREKFRERRFVPRNEGAGILLMPLEVFHATFSRGRLLGLLNGENTCRENVKFR